MADLDASDDVKSYLTAQRVNNTSAQGIALGFIHNFRPNGTIHHSPAHSAGIAAPAIHCVLKGRFMRVKSIPQIAFVISHMVFHEECQILFLKTHLPHEASFQDARIFFNQTIPALCAGLS